MTSPVNLNVAKWLQLCVAAERWARRPEPGAEQLALMAGRLTTVSPGVLSATDQSLTTSFRWDCSAYGLALPHDRAALAPGLLVKAELVRRLLTPGEPGAEAALSPSYAGFVDPAPAWTQRRDIGG